MTIYERLLKKTWKEKFSKEEQNLFLNAGRNLLSDDMEYQREEIKQLSTYLNEKILQMKKEYETAYKNQIEEIAKKKNIQVKKITFWWDNKKEHLKQIEIRGILLKGSDSTLHTTDNPSHVESLKKILMQLYDLEESDVFVEVE